MRNTLLKNIIIANVVVLVSCVNPECKNSDPAFDRYTPTSEEYKTELRKKLQAIDPSFSIAGYEEKEGKEYLLVRVKSEDLCAIMMLDIGAGAKLEEFRKKKGLGYGGAIITGLKYIIRANGGRTEFIYTDCERIID